MSAKMTIMARIRHYLSDIIKPFIAHPGSPEELARGVFVGMFIGMTPTEGFQTALLTLLWSAARPFKKLRFNFKAAFGISLVSNYATIVPLYFMFYYTGALMGRLFLKWDPPLSYPDFARLLEPIGIVQFPESVLSILQISGSFLTTLFLGSLPYAVMLSVLMYRVTYWFITHEKRHARPEIDLSKEDNPA